MSRIDNILNSKPAMPVAGVVGLAGVAAVVLGVMALVGRFDFANKMGHFLGKAGKIGLTAGGGAAVALAIAAIARRAMTKGESTEEIETLQAAESEFEAEHESCNPDGSSSPDSRELGFTSNPWKSISSNVGSGQPNHLDMHSADPAFPYNPWQQ